MAFLHWATCHNKKSSKAFELNIPNYFKIIVNIWTLGSTSFALNIDQNNCILIACDKTYIMESKDELVFVDFFFNPIPLVVYD